MAVPFAAWRAFAFTTLEVTLMLRLLLTSLTGKQAEQVPANAAAEERPITPTTAPARVVKLGRSYPKSVCTSLKDLCEL